MENNTLSDKLLKDLDTAFSSDPNIDEFDFLPVLKQTDNSNPVVLENHKLGIELWAGKVIFMHGYKKLFSKSTPKVLIREFDPQELLQLTRVVLMFNADNATAWNIRKNLIQQEKYNVKDDLTFSALILSKHPKSPETFAHRKWLFLKLKDRPVTPFTKQSCVKGTTQDQVLSREMRDIVDRELEVCTSAARKYRNNYHAWTHRIWLLKTYSFSNARILESELDFTSVWMTENVSDFSGYHYRQVVLSTYHGLMEDNIEKAKILQNCRTLLRDLNSIDKSIKDFPGHETLWNHRRFIVRLLLKFAPLCEGLAPIPNNTQDIVESERQFCAPVTQHANMDQFSGEWEKTLSDKYLNWLERMLALQSL